MALWDKISSRGDVEDRRGMGPVALSGIGLTGVALLLVFNFLAGGNVRDVLGALQQVSQEQQPVSTGQFAGNDPYENFTSTVLGSTNDTWTGIFQKMNKTYSKPKLVLFRVSTDSACGGADSQVGPHYCPNDQTIYLDETFFEELINRFGAKGGDVAEAYVIAHEVGHNVQNQLGLIDKSSSVTMELQADCLAGLWANSIKDKGVFLPGEIEEAMDAAAAVGDDRIQKKVQGYVEPETWTHGSSTSRVASFTKGYESGNITVCN